MTGSCKRTSWAGKSGRAGVGGGVTAWGLDGEHRRDSSATPAGKRAGWTLAEFRGWGLGGKQLEGQQCHAAGKSSGDKGHHDR